MKNKLLLILFFLFSSFFLGLFAKAETIIDSQPTGSVGCYGLACADPNTLKQTFTFTQQETFNHIVFKLDQQTPEYNNIRINICHTADCSGGIDVELHEGIDFSIPAGTVWPATACSELASTTDITLSQDYTLSAGTYYFYLTYGINSNNVVRFCTGEDKITGCFIYTPTGTSCVNDSWDLWVQIYHDTLTGQGSPQYTIQLLTPATTTPFTVYNGMPASFTFNYLNPLNWYPQIRFMVKRLEDSKAHAWPSYVNASTFNTDPSATSTLTYGTASFKLPDGVYDLDAYFWANIPASPVHATTTFTVNTGGDYGGYTFATTTPNKLFKPDIMTDAELCQGIATSTSITDLHIWGDIVCGLKVGLYDVSVLLFVPSFDTLQNFRTSYELFKGCFPFNAFFQITDTVSAVASSTTASTTASLKIPFIQTNGHYYMMSVISSTTLSNWVGVSNYNLFRTTVGYFFWLIAVAIVIITIKYI